MTSAPPYLPKLIDLRLLVPHPLNPRDDLGDLSGLAASIEADGLYEPVVVQPHPDQPRRYFILAGHRRVEAAREAGETTIAASVRPDRGPSAALITMLGENEHREKLNPMAKARSFGYLRDEAGLTVAEIARRTGFAPSVVSGSLALLELSEDTQEAVRTGKISEAQALRAVRQAHRQMGRGGREPVVWEPDHFDSSHPLAPAAGARCKEGGHTSRHKVGNVACGQCWQEEIEACALRRAGVVTVAAA